MVGVDPLKRKYLADNRPVVWTVNDEGNHVMVGASFAGIVELHPMLRDTTGRYAKIKFEWRHEKYKHMPQEITDKSIDDAKVVAENAYMFYVTQIGEE